MDWEIVSRRNDPALQPGANVHYYNLRNALANHHIEHPQRAKLAEMALDEVQSGIAKLASLGHNYHLIEGTPDAPLEWPKMVYNLTQEPRVVHHQSDLDDLGPGWYDTIEAARQHDALGTQYLGRGGVAKPSTSLVPAAMFPVSNPAGDLPVDNAAGLPPGYVSENVTPDTTAGGVSRNRPIDGPRPGETYPVPSNPSPLNKLAKFSDPNAPPNPLNKEHP
jgi:hypothetical protein